MTDYTALFAFLDALAQNNDRGWFAGHKGEYEALRALFTADVQRLIAAMAPAEPALRYVSAADCVYRIYRDIRFSADKQPFKTYFSALISPAGRHFDGACWYLHVGADICALYGGLWTPRGPVLKKVRKAIIDNVEEFRATVETPQVLRDFPDWYGAKLKTAPKGYPKDHPDIDLLRLTEYGKEHRLQRGFFLHPGWPEKAAALALELKPMVDFLNYSIDE